MGEPGQGQTGPADQVDGVGRVFVHWEQWDRRSAMVGGTGNAAMMFVDLLVPNKSVKSVKVLEGEGGRPGAVILALHPDDLRRLRSVGDE